MALPDRYRVRGRLGYPIRGQTGVFEPGCSLSRQPAYVEGPTRSDKRPSVTPYHNARPHTYLNRGWPRSNAAQKSGLRGVTPPQTGRLPRSCSDVNGATSRPQQTTTNAAQLPTTLPSLGPGGVGHGRTSRPCNPVSARRTQGLANASETQKSRLCRPRTRLPVPRRRPARLRLLAPGCVGHGTTSAGAKPAHTRRAWGLGTRQNHRRWVVGGEGRSG